MSNESRIGVHDEWNAAGLAAPRAERPRYTLRVVTCYRGPMTDRASRLNVTLDGEHAAKLARLAEGSHVQEGTLARSLLSRAIDDADVDARTVVEILDGIPGAFDRARLGLEEARSGKIVALEEL